MNVSSLQAIGGSNSEIHFVYAQIGKATAVRNESIVNTQLAQCVKNVLVSLQPL